MDIKNKIIIQFPEPIRTGMGDYYAPITIPSGTKAEYQRTPLPETPADFDAYRIDESRIILALADYVALQKNLTGSSIIPSYTLPIRLYGNSQIIKDNNYWKKYIMGGTFGSASFPGLYSGDVYESLNFDFSSAYTAKEKNEFSTLEDSYGYAPIEISSKYNYYLPRYEQYLTSLNSVKMIPNAYLLAQKQFTSFRNPDNPEPPGVYGTPYLNIPADIKTFTTLEATTNIDNLFSDSLVSYLPPYSGLYTVDTTGFSEETYMDSTAYIRQYFNTDLPNIGLSGSTLANITRLGNNIIFDDHAMATIFKEVEQQAHKLPFYININIPRVRQEQVMATYGTDRLFATMMETRSERPDPDRPSPNFVPFFMRTLKEHFADNRKLLKSTNHINYSTKRKADLETKKITETYESNSGEFWSLDLTKALIANYNDIAPTSQPEEQNYILINADEYTANMVANLNSAYRYTNSQMTLLFLNRMISKLSFPNPLFLQNIAQVSTNTTNVVDSDVTIDWLFLYRLYGMAATTNYNEIIAYRIVKIAGNTAGDNNTQNIVQNFWLYNHREESDSLDDNFNFIDTQVGYGENITYKIFAYVIAVGTKYKASDLVLTREIGETNTGTSCVEYYDPTSGESVPSIFDVSNQLIGSTLTNDFAPNVDATLPALAYQAEYNLQFEPTLRIIEVPLFEKTIAVLDNPAHDHDVVPFQKINNSKEIGFLLNPETFVAGPMPIPLTAAEAVYKKSYIESQDILEGGNVTEKTKSPHTSVKIYRMTSRPQSLQEFASNLYEERDLSEIGEGAENPKCVYYDKLNTNQKYYYLFRFFNAHGAMGHLSPIIQAELISDGGYVYSTFDIIPVEDLDDPKDINPSISAKKLLSIIPNINQLYLDTTEVDFSQPAETQLEKLAIGSPDLSEVLWGRDFKVRLTSTKTGKKIDLNLKFHVNDET